MKIRSTKIIQMVPVSDLIPYKNNPRINDHVVPALCESIKRFGFNAPIVIDEDNQIINGHTRLKAAQKLGMESVPCVYVDDLTEEEKRAYRLADNKIGELAYWDMSKVDVEISKIGEALDMTDFGFKLEGEGVDPGKGELNPEGVEGEESGKPIERTFTHKCPKCGCVFEE